jgi:hypothetical protein
MIPEPALGPIQALRRIDAILADRNMSLPSRVAAAVVVLRAENNTGIAYPGYRYIQERYGLGSDSIREALACPGGRAIGPHLLPAGIGPRGVQKFKVVPPPATQDADASAQPTGALTPQDADASAQPTGALTPQDADASAQPTGALTPQDADASAPETARQRTRNRQPAHPEPPASAPNVGAELTELAHKLTGGTNEHPPTPQARRTGNDGDDNGGLQGQQDPDAALVTLAEVVYGRPLTGREVAAFSQAVAEARAAGATDAGIGDGIRKAGRDAPVWSGPNLARDAAGGKLAELLSSYQRAARLPKPRATLAEIAADVRHARNHISQTPQPSAGDEAAALWHAQIVWADAHPEALPAEMRRPELTAVEVTP